MAETDLQRGCREMAEAMWWLSFRGHGRNGAADYLYLRAGRGFVVEYKTDTGKQSDGQETEEECCIKRGIPYYLVRTLLEMRDVLLIEEAKFSKSDLASMEV